MFSNATIPTFIGAAALLPAGNFPSSRLLSGHKRLQVLRLGTEFNLADCSGDNAVGTGAIATPDGPLGTLRVQLASHQAYVLLNLCDREIVEAVAGWRQAGFLPLCIRVDGNDAVITINIPKSFGVESLDMGKCRPMTAEVFVRLAMAMVASGAVAAQATSDIPSIPLKRTSTNLLATRKVRQAANALDRQSVMEAEVGNVTVH
jgi:hypothetical protein